MNKAEFEAWKQHTEATKYGWTLDPVHNGRNGQNFLFHRGGVNGQFVEVCDGGLIQVGNYMGAMPHIGEAMMKVLYTKECSDTTHALNVLSNAAGLPELAELAE